MTPQRSSKNFTGSILVVAMVLLIAAGTGFAYWSASRTLEVFRSVDQTRSVRSELENFLADVTNAENGQRDFLLTGSDSALDIYQPSIDAAANSLHSLRTLTHDNPRQQQELDQLAPLFEKKVTFWASEVDTRRSKGLDAIVPLVSTIEARQITDDIRKIVGGMENEEDTLLARQSQAMRTASTIMLVVVTLGSGITVLLMGCAALLYRRELEHRRQTVVAAEAARSYSESIVDTIREPLLVIDRQWHVLKANRSYHKMFHLTEKDEPVGRSVFELQNKAWDNPALREKLEKTLSLDQPFDDIEVEHDFPGVGVRAMLLNGRKLYRPGSRDEVLLLAIEDITEHKRVEQMHLQFRALFESLPGLVLVLKPDLSIVAASDEYLKATMTKREQIVGRNIFEAFPDNPDDAAATGVANLRASLNRVLQNSRPDTMTIQKYDVRRPDGVFVERYWSPVNSPVIGANRKMEYIIHRVEDVTDFVKQKERASESSEDLNTCMERAEAEIFRSTQQVEAANQQLRAANAELEAFSYSVSHDLRAPLRHIDGFADMLGKHARAALDDKGRRYLATISESAKRMGALIDDLLVFSRMGRAEMHSQKVDMDALAQEAICEVMEDAKDRRVEWNCDVLPPMTGDPALLRQVLVNLFSNAVKYSRPRDPAIIEIGCADGEAGDKVFFVRDNGVGFDMAYSDKLFGVFQRLHRATEFEGTGIGLANVRRIILRHGGKTWAESKLDEGSTFYFSLPLHLPPV